MKTLSLVEIFESVERFASGDSVCGVSCSDFESTLNQMKNDIDFLKDEVTNLKIQNEELTQEVEDLKVRKDLVDLHSLKSRL